MNPLISKNIAVYHPITANYRLSRIPHALSRRCNPANPGSACDTGVVTMGQGRFHNGIARSLARTLLIVTAAFCVACSSVGPSTVPKDQFDYNGAIAGASQQQLLLNLVRLRYSETPSFLKVSSVISQYTRAGNISAGVGANTGSSGDNTASVGGLMRWSDRPVISYTPVTGKEFAQDMLKPVRPFQLFEMIQSGWPSILVLRSAMVSVNEHRNHVTRPSGRAQADSEFYEIGSLVGLLTRAHVLALRTHVTAAGSEKTVIYIDLEKSPDMAAELARFQSILGLDPDLKEVEMIHGRLSAKNQVAVLTGSIWDIMLRISWQFDAPPEHIETGRTAKSFTSSNEDYVQPIAVRFAKEQPDNAFVSVFTQDYWFYIDKDDRESKRIFSFLELLLTLTQSDVQGVAPVMTISN